MNEIERKYWSNGQLMSEIPRLNGNRHGSAKWWYDNGQLHYEIPHKNDLECGARIELEY